MITTPTVMAEDLSGVPLNELAARIDEAHAGVERSFKAGVEHALQAGALLLEAKARIPHGKWGAWLRDNVRCSDRTARAYMQIAGLDEQKRQRVADLPLRQAIKAIGWIARRQDDGTDRPLTSAPAIEDPAPTGAADALLCDDGPVIDVPAVAVDASPSPEKPGETIARIRQRLIDAGTYPEGAGAVEEMQALVNKLLDIADRADVLDDPAFAGLARQFDIELDPFPGLTWGQLRDAKARVEPSQAQLRDAANRARGWTNFLRGIDCVDAGVPVSRDDKMTYRELIDWLLTAPPAPRTRREVYDRMESLLDAIERRDVEPSDAVREAVAGGKALRQMVKGTMAKAGRYGGHRKR